MHERLRDTFWHPGGATIALYYGRVSVARMLADVEMLTRCLKAGEFLRVYSLSGEAVPGLVALCMLRGYGLRRMSLREDDPPEGSNWRQSGHYVFDIHLPAPDA